MLNMAMGTDSFAIQQGSPSTQAKILKNELYLTVTLEFRTVEFLSNLIL